ncbi:lipoprotein [Desulfuromonas versatilis]|uniref:Lipoprotein n=1 Tax=Desulfuromonas versatilis TaxID=2802975 RepID=A0ABM8HUE8_9BACT|nr:tetratricopeptide repeat protein [Desulfuromonas versatilis]BCR05555.1 lipoprotein [Desulfuromonas versatilis]
MRRNLYLTTVLLLLALLSGCGAPKKAPDDAEVHYILGLSYLREGNYTSALKQFLIAEKESPRRPDIQGALAQAYQLKKAYPEAERHYLLAIDYSEQEPQFQNNLAALYLDMQRWDDALVYFRKASGNLLFGSPEVALTGAGFAHFQKGDYLEALIAYREALSRNPQYVPARFRLGEAYYALDKNDLAIEAYQAALGMAPEFAQGHYQLGLSYLKEREMAKAAESFSEVLRLAPDSEWARLSKDYLKLLK